MLRIGDQILKESGSKDLKYKISQNRLVKKRDQTILGGAVFSMLFYEKRFLIDKKHLRIIFVWDRKGFDIILREVKIDYYDKTHYRNFKDKLDINLRKYSRILTSDTEAGLIKPRIAEKIHFNPTEAYGYDKYTQ